MGSKTYWVFPISKSLGEQIRQLAVDLHQGAISQRQLAMARTDFITHLNAAIDAGFAFYYQVPMENSSSVGPVVRKTVDSIMSAVRHGIHAVVQRVFKNIALQDLQTMAWYLDSMVMRAESGERDLLAFPLGDDLTRQLYEVMNHIRSSNQVADYSREVYQLFADIISASVYYYYQLPTGQIALNRIAKKAADVGIGSTVKGIKSVLKHIIKDVDHEEVVMLPDNIHFLIAERDLDYGVCEPVFIKEKNPH